MAQNVMELEKTEELVTEVARLFPPQGKWTADDYFSLPDTNHLIELSEGRIIFLDMPTTSHQRVAKKLMKKMDDFVIENRLGEIGISPLPVELWKDKIREPDIIFMSNAHRDRITENFWGVPDLVVEVISKSTSKVDRKEKFNEYAQAGIEEYWILDPGKQTIEIFILNNDVYELLGKWSNGEIANSKILSGFSVAVDDIFPKSEDIK